MKRNLMLFLVGILAVSNAIAQKEKKEKPYQANIYFLDGHVFAKVFLLEIKDSALHVAQRLPVKQILIDSATIKSIPVKEIKLIKVGKAGAVTAAASLGSVIGLFVGIGVGAAAYTPCEGADCMFAPTQSGTILLGAWFGLATGFGVGALIGAAKREKFIILGDQQTYESQKTKLTTFLLYPK